jgi:RNA polymerase sigma-70 factor (ECF subfamily)
MSHQFFPAQTAWSTVIEAKSTEESVRLAALERLFTRYRQPICLEFQHRLQGAALEAEELAHHFIHECLRKDFLKSLDPGKGRFRAFIKACITNFILDYREKAAAAKRGGGLATRSLDEQDAEGNRLLEPAAASEPPELAADRHWADQIVALAMERLEQECAAARRGTLFTVLRPFLQGEPEPGSYRAAAAELNLKEGAVRTATSRLRKRLGELIREEIQETTGAESDWREEVRYFLDLIGRAPSVTPDSEFR